MICAACGDTIPPLSGQGAPRICPHCELDPVLDGRYRLEALVGRGAAGETYRALRLEDGHTVAVKELPLHRARSAKARELLAREARVLRQLDHPAIPRFLDDFELGRGKQRHYYIVQDYIDGRSLAEEAADTRYDQSAVLELVEELLPILVYLHELSPPVIHRDLKPENVLRRADGRLALIDFGSVRDVLRDAETGGSTVAGTFGFMAPEQFQGDAHPRTDLYGLGALAVSLLTRKEPRTMLDHNGRIVWEPHVQLHPTTIRYLRRLLQPELSRRMPSARVALTELKRARVARERAPALTSGPLPGVAPEVGAARNLAVAERTALQEPHLPRLPATRPSTAPAQSEDALGWLTGAIKMSYGRAVVYTMVILTASAIVLNTRGTAPTVEAAAEAPTRVGPEEGANRLALSYVRDPGIRGCLSDWRASGALPGDEQLAVAVEQRAERAPKVHLDAGELDGSSLHDCLIGAETAVRWAELDPGLRYHAKFGLPVWDDPEPLHPWPAYSEVPMQPE